MLDFFSSIGEFIQATRVPAQIRSVDVMGLLTNVYFMIPFLALVAHIIYRKDVNTTVLLLLLIGLWVFSGSSYMDDLIVKGELQVDKILPLAGVGVAAVSVVVYLLFIRSD